MKYYKHEKDLYKLDQDWYRLIGFKWEKIIWLYYVEDQLRELTKQDYEKELLRLL